MTSAMLGMKVVIKESLAGDLPNGGLYSLPATDNDRPYGPDNQSGVHTVTESNISMLEPLLRCGLAREQFPTGSAAKRFTFKEKVPDVQPSDKLGEQGQTPEVPPDSGKTAPRSGRRGSTGA